MRKSLCQLLMLALLAYGLDLGCLLRSGGCDESSGCCIGCSSPAQLDRADHAVHVKSGPALLPTETLTITAVALTLAYVLPLLEVDMQPRALPQQKTDPVRGPPSLA